MYELFSKGSTANPIGFNSLKKDITIIVVMKRKHDSLKFPLADFLDNDKTIVDTSAQITRVDVQMETDLSTKDFESSTKFIIRLEQSVSQFYAVVMQYFEKWTPPLQRPQTFSHRKTMIIFARRNEKKKRALNKPSYRKND